MLKARCTYRPERWQQPPEAISAIPGVWGHLLTFIGGPRACIGFRFSLIECVFPKHVRFYVWS